MAGIRFTVRSTRGGGQRFADAIINASRPVVRAASEEMGKQAQENIVANIRSTYGQRRGKQRSEPLASTARYAYRVNSSSRGVQVVFRLEGSAAFKAKFGALNFGTGAHMIFPVNVPFLANKADNFFSMRPVMWKPTNGAKWGTRFYERGIQEAVDQFASFL